MKLVEVLVPVLLLGIVLKVSMKVVLCTTFEGQFPMRNITNVAKKVFVKFERF